MTALLRYADDALVEPGDDDLAAHVAACTVCRSMVDRIRRGGDLLSLAATPPAGLRDRIIAIHRGERPAPLPDDPAHTAAPAGTPSSAPTPGTAGAPVPAPANAPEGRPTSRPASGPARDLAGARAKGSPSLRIRRFALAVGLPAAAALALLLRRPAADTIHPPAPAEHDAAIPGATTRTPPGEPTPSPTPSPGTGASRTVPPNLAPGAPRPAPATPERPSGETRSAGERPTPADRPLAYHDRLVPLADSTPLLAEPAAGARRLTVVGPDNDLNFVGEETADFLKVTTGSITGWVARRAVSRP